MQDSALIVSTRNVARSTTAERCTKTALFPSIPTSRYDQDTIDRPDPPTSCRLHHATGTLRGVVSGVNAMAAVQGERTVRPRTRSRMSLMTRSRERAETANRAKSEFLANMATNCEHRSTRSSASQRDRRRQPCRPFRFWLRTCPSCGFGCIAFDQCKKLANI